MLNFGQVIQKLTQSESCILHHPQNILPPTGLPFTSIDGNPIHYPDPPAVGSNNNHIIAWMNDQIVDIDGGQLPKHSPGFSSVFCHIDPNIRANVQDIPVDRNGVQD